MLLTGALEKIKAVVGSSGWSDDAALLDRHLREERGHWHGSAAMLVQPATSGEVADVVRICAEAKLPIQPQGGNTSLCGGSVPYENFTGIVLALGRMNRVRAVDPVNNTFTVEAGCVLADLHRVAAQHDRLFPLSLGAEGSCQIGGNLSTNAGGTGVLRYGNARELVLGIEVVLPDGTLWDGLRGLRKDSAGYGLRHLFIGAEGTLGIITAAVLKLFPMPTDKQTALVAVPSVEAAVRLLNLLQQVTGEAISSYELMSRVALEMVLRHIPDSVDPFASAVHPAYALVELTGQGPQNSLREPLEAGLAEAQDEGLIVDAVIASSLAQREAFWRLRDSLPEAQKYEGASIKHDVAVPVSRIAEFVRRASTAVESAVPGVRVVAFGHVGDGNIHFNLSQPVGGSSERFLAQRETVNRIVHDIAVDLCGTFSAEHGIGRLKRAELRRYRPAAEIALMERIKKTLDPHSIMNPGKVL
jgi:FAD/FMN-containing dehydrogenase